MTKDNLNMAVTGDDGGGKAKKLRKSERVPAGWEGPLREKGERSNRRGFST